MKAMVLTENQKLSVQEIDRPELANDECRVKITAAGVCSSDIYRAFEKGAYFYPLIMGHELAGRITEKGLQVRNDLQPGDRVAIFPLLPCQKCEPCIMKKYAQCLSYDYYGSRRHGGFAQELNVKDWNLLKIPDHVSDENAAALEPITVTLHAISKLQIQKNAGKLALIGAGFLGLIAITLLKRKHPELEVVVIDRNRFKLDLAENLGAKTVHIKDENDWEIYLKDHRDNFALVLESCGSPLTFRHALSLCKRFGRAVWMGNISGDLILTQKEVSQILRKEIEIAGTWNSDYRGTEKSDWTEALNLLAEGFSIENLLSLKVSLADLPQSIEKLYSNKIRREKHDLIKVMMVQKE